MDNGYEVHLVIVTPHFSRDIAYCDNLLDCCRSVTIFEAEPNSTFESQIPHRVSAHARSEAQQHVRDVLDQTSVDLIHIEGYFMMQHLPDECDVPIFLLEENIEYDLDRSRAEVLGSSATDWTVARDMEHAAWQRAQRCGTVSMDDASVMRNVMPDIAVDFLPNGCDHFSADDASELPTLAAGAARVVYTGNTDWGPSRDATRFLVRDVWPRVLAELPDAVLDVAGNGPEADQFGVDEADQTVRFIGALPSFGPLLHAADVFVCPPRFGGGVKSKILESLHAGCAVVSTPVGLQGLPHVIHDAVICRETPEELAAAIVGLIRDPKLAERLRAKVRRARVALTTWDDAVRRLDKAWTATITSGISGQVQFQPKPQFSSSQFEPV
ncbi:MULTISPECIES: glycosyltransferase family 4 protein [unclassified Rhodococcus (in: high G+C Gram-positive bacteria)]|uniref:glycosyltransferase family 4 protein n=1 Tax=unclassified Rhodococcus (in: high G+C Gram-positive bacteria) TaxID=192944 RepID=UPI0015C6840F|nr:MULTISPECIES: glycosyltransferase family 4 protein [unclassified Rhodococcus (in: high G+C Gram-positive bacteria)]